MNIEINTDMLKSDAKRMREQLNNVKSAMNNMNNAISVLNTMWRGEAQNAFNVQYSSDYDNMLALCDVVNKIIDDFNTAVNAYNNCDSEVREMINSIKI